MILTRENKALLWLGIGVAIAATIALLIIHFTGEAAIGWGIATAVIALTANFTLVAPEKRNVFRTAIMPILAGLVMWAILRYLQG